MEARYSLRLESGSPFQRVEVHAVPKESTQSSQTDQKHEAGSADYRTSAAKTRRDARRRVGDCIDDGRGLDGRLGFDVDVCKRFIRTNAFAGVDSPDDLVWRNGGRRCGDLLHYGDLPVSHPQSAASHYDYGARLFARSMARGRGAVDFSNSLSRRY